MLKPGPASAPPPWGEPLPWRACVLCRHGATVGATRVCTCRDVVQPAQHQPVELVRRQHGACGPEASFLGFPGLHG